MALRDLLIRIWACLRAIFAVLDIRPQGRCARCGFLTFCVVSVIGAATTMTFREQLGNTVTICITILALIGTIISFRAAIIGSTSYSSSDEEIYVRRVTKPTKRDYTFAEVQSPVPGSPVQDVRTPDLSQPSTSGYSGTSFSRQPSVSEQFAPGTPRRRPSTSFETTVLVHKSAEPSDSSPPSMMGQGSPAIRETSFISEGRRSQSRYYLRDRPTTRQDKSTPSTSYRPRSTTTMQPDDTITVIEEEPSTSVSGQSSVQRLRSSSLTQSGTMSPIRRVRSLATSKPSTPEKSPKRVFSEISDQSDPVSEEKDKMKRKSIKR